MWKFWKGYKKWKNFSAEQRARNWKTIKRFTQGVIVGTVITGAVFYSIYWPAIDFYHHNMSEEHTHE